MDRVESTPTRLHRELPWSADAQALLEQILEREPVLVRISAAKRLRDATEQAARAAGEEAVSVERLRGVQGGAHAGLQPA